MKDPTRSEALARLRINNTLQELGWRLDAEESKKANVSLEGDLRSSRDRKRLGRLRPDYTLYAEDSDVPIGIIEAKRPNHPRMEDALKQSIKYAKRLGHPHMVVFASDGNITFSTHVSGRPLTINGVGVQELLPPPHVEKLAENPAWYQGKIIKNTEDLIRIFKQAGNDLRQDGVEAGMPSLREFCLVLFVKIMSEKGKALPGCRWEDLTATRGKNLLVTYRRIVNDYTEHYGDIFSKVQIRRAQTLEKVVEDINDLDFSQSSLDVKGGAYEHFLSHYCSGHKSELGQYFTPRHITRMMAQLLTLNPDDTIYDPFCGTGGMLVACYSLIHNQIKKTDYRKLKKLRGQTLYGRDITGSASQLAKMNMVILGDGHSNITREDSLNSPVKHKYSKVITNIPFNLKNPEIATAELYGDTVTNANTLCVKHCLLSIKHGGQAAIILPENIAYAENYQYLRNYIRDNSSIRAVIRLPRAVFTSYTAARTFILLLEGVWTDHTETFPITTIDNDGWSSAKKREPIPGNEIPTILGCADNLAKHYPTRDATTPCFKFFEESQTEHAGTDKTWSLRELIHLITEKTTLDPNETYFEPRLSALTNTVAPVGKQGRLGRNIRTKEKILTKPGDLIIAKLHTQSGNGLFAFSDREYVATSQIVAEVNEQIVSKEYLKYALRKILPTLEKDDLVGRETYSEEEILSVRIPKPTPRLAKAFKSFEKKHREIEDDLLAVIQAEEAKLPWPRKD